MLAAEQYAWESRREGRLVWDGRKAHYGRRGGWESAGS